MFLYGEIGIKKINFGHFYNLLKTFGPKWAEIFEYYRLNMTKFCVSAKFLPVLLKLQAK